MVKKLQWYILRQLHNIFGCVFVVKYFQYFAISPRKSYSLQLQICKTEQRQKWHTIPTACDFQALTTCGAFSQRIRPRIILYAYVNFFVTFATKVLHFKFCDKMRQFLIWKWIEREEIDREWGNLESESLSPFPHSLSISSFSLHFLFISSFSLHFLAARLQGCNDSCSPGHH